LWIGEKRWNGGNEHDQSHGDFSARKTLKLLKLPLAKSKRGRPIGVKSITAGKQGKCKRLHRPTGCDSNAKDV
jgi:hypothetical protein